MYFTDRRLPRDRLSNPSFIFLQERTMRTFITTSDGEVYKAEDALDFVQQLKDSSRMAEGLTLNQFMREVAQRAEQDTGFRIRTHCVGDFLDDLLAAGLVKEQVTAE